MIESLLGFWIYVAGGPIERTFAGSLMTIIFVSFLLTVVRIGPRRDGSLKVGGLEEEVAPAREKVSAQEIDEQVEARERIAGPDRSYLIDRPPPDWRIGEPTYLQWLSGNLQVTDTKVLQELGMAGGAKILTFTKNTETIIVPIPGTTTLEGRQFPTALSVPSPTQLAIIPREKRQPPMFAERTFVHSFMTFLAQILKTGVLPLQRMSSGNLPDSSRPFFMAELHQEVENALINRKEGRSIRNTLVIIGIEGEVRDHYLIMKYPSRPTVDDPALAEDRKVLNSLINSFQPLKAVDPEREREALRAEADEQYALLVETNGEKIFMGEFGLVCLRLKGRDLENAEHRRFVIEQLEPFEALANQLEIEDDDLDALWSALDEAKRGDVTNLKTTLTELLDETDAEAADPSRLTERAAEQDEPPGNAGNDQGQ